MKTKLLCSACIIISLFSIGCATTKTEYDTEEVITQSDQEKDELGDHPDWLLNPPLENRSFFGIGVDLDLTRAKQLSIVNVGQQFSVQINSVLTEYNTQIGEENESVISSIDTQVTNQVIYGAKFVDQYQDPEGRYWVLTKAPLECILDATEGVMLSYNLDIWQDDVIVDTIIEKIEEKIEFIEEYYIEEQIPPEEPVPPPAEVEEPSVEIVQNEDIEQYNQALGLSFSYSQITDFEISTNPLYINWLGGSVSFIITKPRIVFYLYPGVDDDVFSLTLAGEYWFVHIQMLKYLERLKEINLEWLKNLESYYGMGPWVDFIFGDQIGFGTGIRANIGMQFWFIKQLGIFYEVSLGLGYYFDPFWAIAFPASLSAGARLRF